MARCNCTGQTCGCRLVAGENITLTGAGTARDPWVISATAGGEGGSSGWAPGDRKETYRQDVTAGWLECNGQAVSRATYAALFSAVGTRFGAGDGVNTFNLPNETGRVSLGMGPGYPQDQTGGAASTTLTQANLPPHTHTMAHTHTINHSHGWTGFMSADHSHGFTLRWNDNFATGGSNPRRGVADFQELVSSSGGTPVGGNVGGSTSNHQHYVPDFAGNSGGSSTPNTGSVGAGSSFTNLPPYRAMRVLIKT